VPLSARDRRCPVAIFHVSRGGSVIPAVFKLGVTVLGHRCQQPQEVLSDRSHELGDTVLFGPGEGTNVFCGLVHWLTSTPVHAGTYAVLDSGTIQCGKR